MKEIIVSGYAYPSINPAVLEAWLPDLTFLNTFSYGITAWKERGRHKRSKSD